MNEHNFTRGDRFQEHNDPNVDEMYVLATGEISGYEGVRLAEYDSDADRWRAYWAKQQHIQDELNLDIVEHGGTVSETKLESVEERVRASVNGLPTETAGRVAVSD